MLITKTYHDVPSKLDGGKPIRIYVISPVIANYPKAKFPGSLSNVTFLLSPDIPAQELYALGKELSYYRLPF